MANKRCGGTGKILVPMTRTLLLTLLFCLLPWTVKGHEPADTGNWTGPVKFSPITVDSGLWYVLPPKPTIRVPIETLKLYNEKLVWVDCPDGIRGCDVVHFGPERVPRGHIQIDSVFEFIRIDTIWEVAK